MKILGVDDMSTASFLLLPPSLSLHLWRRTSRKGPCSGRWLGGGESGGRRILGTTITTRGKKIDVGTQHSRCTYNTDFSLFLCVVFFVWVFYTLFDKSHGRHVKKINKKYNCYVQVENERFWRNERFLFFLLRRSDTLLPQILLLRVEKKPDLFSTFSVR